MSDAQHPEIIDIGLPAQLPPLNTGELESICAGLMVNVKEPQARIRSMAAQILELQRRLAVYESDE